MEKPQIPDRMFFKISEVAKITGIKPYVLRYWESEFDFITPNKSKANQRVYEKSDIELILRIKHLLYVDKYTIAGAKQRLKDDKKVEKVVKKEEKREARFDAIREKILDLHAYAQDGAPQV